TSAANSETSVSRANARRTRGAASPEGIATVAFGSSVAPSGTASSSISSNRIAHPPGLESPSATEVDCSPTVCSRAVLQLYSSTAVKFQAIGLHFQATLRLDNTHDCTTVQLYNCMTVQLYDCTTV